MADEAIDKLDELNERIVAKGHDELDELFVAKGHAELDELIMAEWAIDELDELIMAEGRDDLDELIMAEGHDELDELFMATGCDEHNNLVVARSQDELNELACDEFARLVVDKVSENTIHLCCCWPPFSLTKYSAIIAEVKRYFRNNGRDNQLGCSLTCKIWIECVNMVAVTYVSIVAFNMKAYLCC